MNIHVYTWQRRVRGLTIAEHDILFRFSFYAHRGDAACFPSIGTITRELEADRRYIERTIRDIENKGFIKKKAQKLRGRKTTNRYDFQLDRFFPKGEGEKRGLVVLRKIKDFLAKNAGNDEDIQNLLMGGFKFAWVDEPRKKLWIAVESRSHEDYFAEQLEEVFAKVIGYHPGPKTPQKPLLSIEFLRLYVTKED